MRPSSPGFFAKLDRKSAFEKATTLSLQPDSKMETDQRIAMLKVKIIGITGKIELHQGKPEIEVTSADQIKLMQ
jgi:DNA/RNA endonuclease YhcR with UshA esterase domain